MSFTLSRAQQTMSGSVSNGAGEPVEGAIITVKNLDGDRVIAYGVSDGTGHYKLVIKYPDDMVLLEVSFLGYAKQSIAVSNKSGVYNFILAVSTEQLKEVVIKSAPIYQVGDTLNYDISEFTSARDRVIGDVLRKLPGIETLSDGQILYQGKPIQKYYINGLDLLGGRYRMANDNLPVDAVKRVQVIENDQPIKILDSLVFSDRASLNIELKKFTTTGSATVGIGAKPFLREVNITPMTFHKDFQAIHSFQSNNTGIAVNRQLRGYYNQVNYQEADYLNIQEAQVPPFDEDRWLDNSINLGSMNVLKKLKNDIELKGNLSYYNDYQRMSGDVVSTIFTPDREIRFTESMDNRLSIDDLRGSITTVKNTKKVYFENKTDFQRKWRSNRGNLFQNTERNVLQKLNMENLGVDNTFSANTYWGKQLIQIGSIINYSKDPQSLRISPGPFEETLNQGDAYDQVVQHVRQANLLTDNFLGFSKALRRFTISPKLGIRYQNQRLNSNLNTLPDGLPVSQGDDFGNDLRFVNSEIYGNLRTQYKLGDLKAEFFLPVTFQSYKTENQSPKKQSRFFIDPRLGLNYEPHPFWTLSGNVAHVNQLGGIDELYTSYILSSYRHLQKFNGLVPEASNTSGIIAVHYKNPLKSVFSNFSFSHSLFDRNYIYNTVINDEGLSTIELLEYQNQGYAEFVEADVSKYIHSLKTTFKLGAEARFSESDYILNEQESQLKSESYSTSFMASYNQIDFLSLVYTGSLSYFNSRISLRKINQIILQEHRVQLHFQPMKNQILTLDGELFKSNSSAQDMNQAFINASYRLSFAKRKLDFEFRCNNLLNTDSYTTFIASTYSVLQNRYSLRPRQFLVSAAFRF